MDTIDITIPPDGRTLPFRVLPIGSTWVPQRWLPRLWARLLLLPRPARAVSGRRPGRARPAAEGVPRGRASAGALLPHAHRAREGGRGLFRGGAAPTPSRTAGSRRAPPPDVRG